MPSVFSQRHLVNFYLALFLITLFWAFMALMTGSIFIHDYGTDKFATRYYGLLVMLAFEITGGVYTVIRYFKLAPTIEVSNEYIKFWSTLYYWSDVKRIELRGKHSFIFLISKEGSSIILKSGGKRIFLDSLYSNTGEIKRFIQDVIIDKKPFPSTAINTPSAEEASGETFAAYKGVQLYNYRGIILWLIESAMVYVAILNRNSNGALIFCLVTALVSFFGVSHFMNYFELSDRFLSVRNHNLLWKKKLYRVEDIKEIVLDQPEKMPVCLRVITNDFESKHYPAGTLWDKDWRALKKALEAKNIPVRDESCVGSGN